jgi:NAD(P)-dependent dehydrogenase (short-subunit alcohol dehydrogenase family)
MPVADPDAAAVAAAVPLPVPLTGRHALITGGGTGIGAAIARALSDAGAAVSLAGRRAAPVQEVASSLSRACAVVADVTRESGAGTMLDAARAAFGPVDIVVANAGAAESAPAARLDLAHWQRMLDVNLTGAFLTARAALPDLTRADGPEAGRRIVFIASTAGLKGYPYVAAYCAAKHGVVGLARALAAELAPRGITVKREDAARELARHNPQGRFVAPAEVAATVLFLCTPAAQAITGQAISVSGGET